ncbi:aldo/keto reductase [Cladochytrium replicatum]|nr:aldo/keto reductase [Cladochytrium replicatum]
MPVVDSFGLPYGLTLSRLIYGTWRILDDTTPPTPELLLERIEKCIELGITTFDLADIYGGGEHQCERAFGAGLALKPELRSQIQLVTKCGIRIVGEKGLVPVYYDTSEESVIQRVEESLQAVGTTYFDCVLIHRPDPLMDADSTARAFEKLQRQGKVRHIGVSNFLPSSMNLLQSKLSSPLVINQIELSPLHMDHLHDGTVELCQERTMAIMAWSPLGGGRLLDASSTDPQVQRVRAVLVKLGEKYGASIDQMAYAWILRHPANCLPVLGTNKIERIVEATKAIEISGNLTAEEWYAVWVASKGHNVP